jgi:hypothetical protein
MATSGTSHHACFIHAGVGLTVFFLAMSQMAQNKRIGDENENTESRWTATFRFYKMPSDNQLASINSPEPVICTLIEGCP